ncbi:hypothetical protein [Kosakonia radicincitans]|uniref:hypothetical protein n=1 Tax=Kosakonia radicincitans TaxID=283686 RepID=UPI0008FB21E1|nr:hypothetical protein [Kosakonia radicincitans]
MKKLGLVFCIALGVAFLTGCAPKPPSAVEISTANYGSLPGNYQDLIKDHFNVVLKDPESARYTFMPPYKGYSQDGALAESGGGVRFGYVVPVLVNAKNSYGGYTGNHQYAFIFSNGVLYDITANYLFGRAPHVQ